MARCKRTDRQAAAAEGIVLMYTIHFLKYSGDVVQPPVFVTAALKQK